MFDAGDSLTEALQAQADKQEEALFIEWRFSRARYDCMIWHLRRAEWAELHGGEVITRVAASGQRTAINARLQDFGSQQR